MRDGVSQQVLADEMRVSRSTVAMWERGTEPSNEMLQKLAEYFNITVDYLLGRDEPTDAEPVYTQDDPEFWELREQLRREPGMRTLFFLTKNATSEDMKKMIALIKAYKGDDYDDPC